MEFFFVTTTTTYTHTNELPMFHTVSVFHPVSELSTGKLHCYCSWHSSTLALERLILAIPIAHFGGTSQEEIRPSSRSSFIVHLNAALCINGSFILNCTILKETLRLRTTAHRVSPDRGAYLAYLPTFVTAYSVGTGLQQSYHRCGSNFSYPAYVWTN